MFLHLTPYSFDATLDAMWIYTILNCIFEAFTPDAYVICLSVCHYYTLYLEEGLFEKAKATDYRQVAQHL